MNSIAPRGPVYIVFNDESQPGPDNVFYDVPEPGKLHYNCDTELFLAQFAPGIRSLSAALSFNFDIELASKTDPVPVRTERPDGPHPLIPAARPTIQ